MLSQREHPKNAQISLDAPHRIQRQRTAGWRKPKNTVNVTRPGPWGNYAGSTREAFERDLATMSNADRAFYCDKAEELRGKNLMCWCRLCDRHRRTGKPFNVDCSECAPCHADALGELANLV